MLGDTRGTSLRDTPPSVIGDFDTMPRLREHDAIYEAATRWKQRCLLGDGSVFGSTHLWTTEHIAELVKHFIDDPDTSDRSFEEKLKDQLSDASPGATQLAAEMLWVMMLFPSNIAGYTKETLVRTVWEWSRSTLEDSSGALEVLENGIGSGGPGYNNYRPLELQLVIRFAGEWKTLGEADQKRLLAAPWQFGAWFDRLPDAPKRQFRHMLFHLLFPDDFERISSTNQKKQLDRRLKPLLANSPLDPADRGPSALARDRRILEIHRLLQAEHPGGSIDFYSNPDIRAMWQGEQGADAEDAPDSPSQVAEPAPPGHRVWVIGAGEAGAEWETFFERGYAAIGWEELGDLREYGSADEIREALTRAYESKTNPTMNALACYQFSHDISVGDEIYAKQGRQKVLGVGRIVGDYEYDPSRPGFPNVRRVEWLRRGNWTLPDDARLTIKTLTDVTGYAAFREFMQAQVGAQPPSPDPETPYFIDDLMEEAFLPQATVEEILGALRRRMNVLLQGPPGVGKSFLARRLAHALIGAKSRDNVLMVQFHQSYAYEDFIQGWRPNGEGGFVLRDGVFYNFCLRAQSHPGEPHVFIIDEINRGNLSKVFGELMLLIEPDKRGQEFAIPLTYSESAADAFFVPDNLYLIGLMNTADRSLAMVDYALRRRFAFVTLSPQFDSPAFAALLGSRGISDAVISRIVERIPLINEQILGDHKNLGAGFLIGHSYFCPTQDVSDSEAWYSAIVKDEIEPLLREYWFDDDDRVARCWAILTN